MSENDTKTETLKITNPKIMPEVEPTQDDLDEIEEGEDEDGDEEDDEGGLGVYSVYLVDNPTPVPVIDDRDYEDMVGDFGRAVGAWTRAEPGASPFFAFNGDPDAGYIGSALVRLDKVASIQSLVTAEELQAYLESRDEDDGEEDEVDDEVAEHNRQIEARKAAKRAKKEAEAAKVKPGNKGPKGGKGGGARGLV